MAVTMVVVVRVLAHLEAEDDWAVVHLADGWAAVAAQVVVQVRSW